MLSIYHDARSPVHAVPAGAKLALLALVGLGSFFVADLRVLGGALLLVVLGYALARVPVRLALRQVGFALPFVAVIFLAQLWLVGPLPALVVVVRLLVLLLLAGLVTLTTRATALIAVIEKVLGPLRPLGVSPERVGMVIMMTLRFVPVIKEQADAIRAAQRARGVERSFVFLTPLLVKTLRMADGLAQALDARGVEATRPRTGR